MENKLKRLFDYQKFAPNPRLDGMLADAERRCTAILSDEALDLVSAAGEPDAGSLPFDNGIVEVRPEISPRENCQ